MINIINLISSIPATFTASAAVSTIIHTSTAASTAGAAFTAAASSKDFFRIPLPSMSLKILGALLALELGLF